MLNRFVAVILVLGLWLTACSSAPVSDAPAEADEATAPAEADEATVPAEADEAAEPKELVYAGSTPVETLDGAFVRDEGEGLSRLIYNRLFTRTPEQTVEPEVVETWTVENDVNWTFELREGFVFSNGNPLTAESVKFTIERVLDEATGSPNRSALASIESVEVVDDYTVRITTSGPAPDLLLGLSDRASLIHDPEAVQQYDDPRDVGRNPVGSGPYQLSEWVPGERIVLERNPHWNGDQPPLDRIVYVTVPEATTSLAMLQRGEADVITNPPVPLPPDAASDSDLQVIEIPGFSMVTLEMNTIMPPLDDVRVRKAIAHSINRDVILDNILDDLGVEHCTTVGPAVGSQFLFQQPCYEYDPERAMELLAEAGYPDGFSITMDSFTGFQFKDDEITEAIQAMLSDVGIDVELRRWDIPTLLERVQDPERQLWFYSRSSGFTDFIFTRQFDSAAMTAGENLSQYTNERVDELLVLARQEFDEEERAAYYREIQEITWDELPLYPLYVEKAVVMARSNVTGLVLYPDGLLGLLNTDKN